MYAVAFGFALILIKARIYREHTNRLGITDMELFNLKIHINFKFVKLITRLQKLHGIATEPADRFYNNVVNLPSATVHHHSLKFLHMKVISAGSLIGININENPIELFLYKLLEIVFLNFKAVMLYFLIGADTAICSNLAGKRYIKYRFSGYGFYFHICPSFLGYILTIKKSESEAVFDI